MAYNLLRERWIAVRRRSGASDWIAPHQIAERDDPPVAIASPRPDFDGALIQFLIGLMQTTAAPKDKRAWERRYEQLHTPEELREQFATVEAAFNLDGEGPRFMQDLTLNASEASPWDIADLLITSPGENTIKNNSDFFIKRGEVSGMGLEMAAAALLTLQLNSPEGGGGSAGGHNVSIRGGGPLTTIAIGRTLVETAWLNVLVADDFNAKFGNPEASAPGSVFPWEAPTRSGGKKAGVATTPAEVHPLHQFWAMPRRIRLEIDPSVTGRCSLTGRKSIVVARCITAASGYRYLGELFRHPLSPYRKDASSEDSWRAIRSRSDALAYSYWPSITVGSDVVQPARCISAARERSARLQVALRIRSFGFETKQEKARAWHDGVAPIISVDEEREAAFRAFALRLVDASDTARRTLIGAVEQALAPRQLRKDEYRFKPDSGAFSLDNKSRLPDELKAEISAAFWARTEPSFFEAVAAVRDTLPDVEKLAPISERWLEALHQAALALFETYSQANGDFGAADVRRVAVAWNELRRFTHPHSPLLRKAVGLAVKEPEQKKPKTKRSKKKEEQP